MVLSTPGNNGYQGTAPLQYHLFLERLRMSPKDAILHRHKTEPGLYDTKGEFVAEQERYRYKCVNGALVMIEFDVKSLQDISKWYDKYSKPAKLDIDSEYELCDEDDVVEQRSDASNSDCDDVSEISDAASGFQLVDVEWLVKECWSFEYDDTVNCDEQVHVTDAHEISIGRDIIEKPICVDYQGLDHFTTILTTSESSLAHDVVVNDTSWFTMGAKAFDPHIPWCELTCDRRFSVIERRRMLGGSDYQKPAHVDPNKFEHQISVSTISEAGVLITAELSKEYDESVPKRLLLSYFKSYDDIISLVYLSTRKSRHLRLKGIDNTFFQAIMLYDEDPDGGNISARGDTDNITFFLLSDGCVVVAYRGYYSKWRYNVILMNG